MKTKKQIKERLRKLKADRDILKWADSDIYIEAALNVCEQQIKLLKWVKSWKISIFAIQLTALD